MRELKYVQKWECAKCNVTVPAPIRYSAVFCRKAHKMKLIEGELPVIKKKNTTKK